MKRRTIALSAVGVGALVAAATKLRPTPDLEPALAGEHHTYRWRGMDIAYTTAGNPTDQDILLLHGIHAAATAQEFQGIWEALATSYHVVAPDLPGFGRSDRPAVQYSPDLYEAFIADFTDDTLDSPICVGSSLTGAHATGVATDRFDHLILVCPTDDVGEPRPWLYRVFHAPILGDVLFTALTIPPSLRWWTRQEGYEHAANIAAGTIEYQHSAARQPGARFAPAAFIGGELTPSTSLADSLTETSVPVTLIWGRDATRTPLELGRDLAAVADTDLLVVDESRLLPHAEHPTAVLRGLVEAGFLDNAVIDSDPPR